jgi:broad specificity phosphatase PhoE
VRLVFVRHAETRANAENRFQGQAPPPAFGLSPAGWEQAAALKKRFESEGFTPTHFYCSPLQRCLDTASVLAGLWQVEPVAWDDLQEIDVGIVQGLTWDEAKRKYPNIDLGERGTISVPGAELLQTRKERAERVVRTVLRNHDDDAVVLMVSHGGILIHIIAALLGSPRCWEIDIGNTAVFDFQVDSTRWDESGDALLNPELWRIDRFNDASHLI